MFDVRVHHARDYRDLRDMDLTDVGVITHADRACLQEIGEWLVQTESHRRFGVSLLHSHFPITDDEFLVETADPKRRIVHWRPMARSRYSDDTFEPVNLSFESGEDDNLRMVGLEYCSRKELGAMPPLSDADVTVLRGIRAILLRHGAIDRFGVKLAHNALAMTEDEVLLEVSDQESRELTCEITHAQDPRFQSSIETYWRWAPSYGPDGTVMEACGQKCVKACVKVGDKHQSGKHS